MKTVMDFLSLRPIWTRRGLEIVWYIYVAATLISLGFSIYPYTAGTISRDYLFLAIYSILFPLAHLALIRIFLELALRYLIGDLMTELGE